MQKLKLTAKKTKAQVCKLPAEIRRVVVLAWLEALEQATAAAKGPLHS